MEDSAFVERLIARDPGAWRRFAREHEPLLVRAAAGVLGDADAISREATKTRKDVPQEKLRGFVADQETLRQSQAEARPQGASSVSE